MDKRWIIAVVVLLVLLGRKVVFAVKPGALPSNRPEIENARRVVVRVYSKYGYSVTVTSGEEAETSHMAQSKHYAGLAEDYRTKDIQRTMVQPIVSEIRAILGRDYDVVLEAFGQSNEHLHIEYDPK